MSDGQQEYDEEVSSHEEFQGQTEQQPGIPSPPPQQQPQHPPQQPQHPPQMMPMYGGNNNGQPVLMRPVPQPESFFQRLLRRGFALVVIAILALVLWWWWSGKSVSGGGQVGGGEGGAGGILDQVVDQTKRVLKLPPQMN